MSTVDRLPRLLTLVPYLLAHPGAELAEVADAFGVTERQLEADLRLIWMCGLPGHTPADLIDVCWDGDTITVSNADTIARPLRLDADEASALLVALRTLAELPGLTDRDALERVTAKLESAAGDAAAASTQVAVDVETGGEDGSVGAVRDALDRRRRLRLRYYVPGRDEITDRDTDPMRLLVVEGRSYLEAYCRRAEGVRLFRLDRMVDLDVLDVAAEVPPDAEHRDVDEGLFQPSAADQSVTLELTEAGRWVADYYPCESVTESDGGLRVSLRTPDTGWVRRLVLRLGPAGRIVDPPDLAELVRVDAFRGLEAYGLQVR